MRYQKDKINAVIKQARRRFGLGSRFSGLGTNRLTNRSYQTMVDTKSVSKTKRTTKHDSELRYKPRQPSNNIVKWILDLFRRQQGEYG